jgi:hypothetical protein
MMRFLRYMFLYRVRVISVFALVYPVVAALVRNALWRRVDIYFLDSEMYGYTAFLELVGLYLGPPLAAFALLPYGRIRRMLTGFLYLLLMLPAAIVFQKLTYCYFNPLCSRF